MQTTSLQILVMLVGQAGGDFQPQIKTLDGPDLSTPPIQAAPLEAAPIAPAKAEERAVESVPALPERNGSQFAPSKLTPRSVQPAPASVLNSPRREVLESNASNDELRTPPEDHGQEDAPRPPIQFAPTNQSDPSRLPLPAGRARILFQGAPRAAAEATKELVQQAVSLPDGPTAFSGAPTSLRQALGRVSDRDERIAVIKIYWQLAVAIADHNHASNELTVLSKLPDPRDDVEDSQLRAAVTTASARVVEAQLVVLATQHELVRLMKSGGGTLPLTSDAPFVGLYEPRFEQIFAGRTAPANLRKLAESLPYYLELVNARANSVLAAEAALERLAGSYAQGNLTYSPILDGFEKLRDQRITFLATVRDYNNAIADYSLNTISVGLNTDAVVATLIETEPTPSVLISSGGVRPASATVPIRSAGQPTPVAQPGQLPAASSRLVPVEQPIDQFVPRRVVPAAVSNQPTPASPLTPIPAEFGQQR